MSKKTRKAKPKPAPQAQAEDDKATKRKKPIPQPVNVVDGVPDCAQPRSRKRLAVVVAIFAAWMAVLVYCLLAAPATAVVAG